MDDNPDTRVIMIYQAVDLDKMLDYLLVPSRHLLHKVGSDVFGEVYFFLDMAFVIENLQLLAKAFALLDFLSDESRHQVFLLISGHCKDPDHALMVGIEII